MIRTVAINVAVFLGLAGTAFFAIPVVDAISTGITALTRRPDQRGLLPNYADIPWAGRHFEELRRLSTDYESFTGWRRRPFQGTTITVQAGTQTRQTPRAGPEGAGRSVYFFGGSAIWGTGSDDASTIPAMFQRRAGGDVRNFGESGWTAHQSLNQLIKLYAEGHRPDVVVFYDGYNDVRTKCRSGSDFWAHEREPRIRQATAYRPTEAGYYLQSVLQAVNTFTGGTRPGAAGCDSNPRTAELVAEQMVLDWKLAEMLVTANGGRFHAFLQPVAYFSATRTNHIMLQPPVRAQFEAVYSRIRHKIRDLPWTTDLTDALDQDTFIYIDDCHVSPNGNALVAERMQRYLN